MFSLKIDKQIQLKLVHPSFAPLYVKLAKENYDDLAKWLVWPPHCQTEEDFSVFITQMLHEYADGKSMTCGVFFNDELVGNVCYKCIDHQLKKVEIGYWLASRYQGKGIVTRVCKMLVDYAFDELLMDKVEISAATGNKASRAVCERLGMTLEGVITNVENINGRIVDHAFYGLKRN